MGRALYVLILLIISICYGCSNTPTVTSDSEADQPDTVQYEISLLERRGPCIDSAETRCLEIFIESFNLLSGAPDAALIAMEDDLNKRISSSDNLNEPSQTPFEIADKLQAEYSQLLSEIKGYSIPWHYRQDFDVYLNNETLFGVFLRSSNFSGGAHPLYFEFYFNYTVDDGRILGWKDLFLPKFRQPLLDAAERQFRVAHDMDPDMTFDERGFWFEDEEFFLPENFKLGKQGLVFIYNPYEIGPWSEGAIKLTINYAEIGSWMVPEYRLK